MIETIFASVGLPIVLDLLKNIGGAASRKWLGLSVEDQVKLENSNIQRLEALSKLDNPHGTPSQWVIDLRGSFRYLAAGILVLGGTGMAIYGSVQNLSEIVPTGLEIAVAPFGFIFGERLVLSFKSTPR